MFFRRVFATNGKTTTDTYKHDYKEMFEDNTCDHSTSPSHSATKVHRRRASIEEKQSRGLSVLQLTPLWEHIIRTNSMPRGIVLEEVFEEFYERLHDPEWQVRQHALRVLVDVLIVMGQAADYHIQNLIHPLVDNLGHIAPAVRKGSLDCLRVYVAQTAMPETVMLDIMNYGMGRPSKDPFNGRMSVAVILALPALILPILITPKRSYVVKAVIDALTSKMVKITYQEIALKILLKIKEMVGETEFYDLMAVNIQKDFELLCKVYGLPKVVESQEDIHVPANDVKKQWANGGNKFIPKPQENGKMNGSDGARYFGSNYDATYPFERTKLGNNLGTPRKVRSPRTTTNGILRSSSETNLKFDKNGNSSESETGSNISLKTKYNTVANSKSHQTMTTCIDGKHCEVEMEPKVVNGKVIMETEIKLTPETAVTMRILEQNPSTQTDDSDDENNNGMKRIITDFSTPYPVTPMKPRNFEDINNNNNGNNHLKFPYEAPPKNGRRVRFGGEIVKMRTPDSEAFDHSDDNESVKNIRTITLTKTRSDSLSEHFSDNSSISSDNSHTHDYIRQASAGYADDQSLLRNMRTNIEHMRRSMTPEPQKSVSFQKTAVTNPRPISAKQPSVTFSSPIEIASTSHFTCPHHQKNKSPENSRPTSRCRDHEDVSHTTHCHHHNNNQHHSSTKDDEKTSFNFLQYKQLSRQNSTAKQCQENHTNFPPRQSSQESTNEKFQFTRMNSKPELLITAPSSSSTSQSQSTPQQIKPPHPPPKPLSKTQEVQPQVRREKTMEISEKRPQQNFQMRRQNTVDLSENRPNTSSFRPVVHSPPESRPSTSMNFHPPQSPKPPLPPKTNSLENPRPSSRAANFKSSHSSSLDYSKELTIGIPDVETVLPGHFTPPNIMIKRPSSSSPSSDGNNDCNHFQRPATSPMMTSPRHNTYVPPTSITGNILSLTPHSNAAAPSTPGSCSSPSKRQERTFMRRSVSSLSPREVHRGVTMLHNLARSPGTSPGRCQSSRNYDDYDYFRSSSRNESHMCSRDASPIMETRQQQQQPEVKSWEELGIVDYFVLKDLKSGDWRCRSRAITAIEEALKSSDNLVKVQPVLDSLLRSLQTAERHPEVLDDQRRVLCNLISRLPLENLEDRVTQIITGLCRQGGGGANLVGKSLMQRLPTAAIVHKLLSDDFLYSKGSKFREHALQMVIFALQTFPSTYFDVGLCVEQTAKAALDRKKRVRQAALDVLAVLGQISSPKTVIEKVSHVVENRKEELLLIAAVKARLARKQLPLVGSDGEVQYALKIPSAQFGSEPIIMFGSDIEWICSGSGSVSPISLKNRSLLRNQESTAPMKTFDERRITDGLNRYAHGYISGNSSNKNSPWSKIPVRNSSSGSEDDPSFTMGQAYQGVQKPIESTGRFQGRQSRSFPELSDTIKERVPIRQLSDSQQSSKNGQTKLPVASSRFPAVETNNEGNSCGNNKNPYSFGPNYKSKYQQKFNESNESPKHQSTQLESVKMKRQFSTETLRSSARLKQRNHSDEKSSPKKNSAKSNELTIQQLTSAIGLVESDDARSEREQEVIKTQPKSCSAKSTKEERCESYVEEQVKISNSMRRTNSHILSDFEMSNGATPMISKEPTSTELANVRNELQLIQSTLANVRKEMIEISRQKSSSSAPSSRPHSVNSNKTFVMEDEQVENDAAPEKPSTTMEFVKIEDIQDDDNESIPPMKPQSASLKVVEEFNRLSVSQKTDDNDGNSSIYDMSQDSTACLCKEDRNEKCKNKEEEVDEVDRVQGRINEPNMMESSKDYDDDGETTIATEEEIEITKVTIKTYEEDSSSPQPNENDMYSSETTTPKKRPPPLKRSQRMQPIKNPMPNINQPSTVVHVMKPKPQVSSVFPSNLRRFDRPKDAIHLCLEQLESSSWEDVMDGLSTFVRLIRHHPEVVDMNIHAMTVALSKHVRNLRSQVARAACSCASEFFITNSKSLEADAEDLVQALLNRTADTNKFIRADAMKALETMCDAMQPSKVILMLAFRGASHQNAAVRCSTAKLLNQLIFRIGCDKIFSLHKDIRDRLILTAAHLLMEGSLETRNHTKEIFKQLSIHSHYQKMLLEVIPANVYRNIEKSLKSIR